MNVDSDVGGGRDASDDEDTSKTNKPATTKKSASETYQKVRVIYSYYECAVDA